VTLEQKLKEIPASPGVYLHKDGAGKILYIGKAKSLRSRVRQYFQAGGPVRFGYDIKTVELVIEEAPWHGLARRPRRNDHELVGVRIAWNESE